MVLFLDTPGSRRISRQDLMRIPLPEETRTFSPVDHHSALSLLERTLKEGGYEVEYQLLGVSRKGNHMFCTLETTTQIFERNRDSVRMCFGLRNSHLRDMSLGVVCGETVFLCSNLSFSGSFRSFIPHRGRIQEELTGFMRKFVGESRAFGRDRRREISSLVEHPLNNERMDILACRALDMGALNTMEFVEARRLWKSDYVHSFGGFNLWSALQCFTETKKPSFQKGGSRALSAANSTRVINDILLEEGCIG